MSERLTRGFGVGLAVLAVTTVVWALSAWRGSLRAASWAAADLQASVAALEAQRPASGTAEVQRIVQTVAAAPPSAVEAPAAPAKEPQLPPLQHLDDAFVAEVRDPAWAPATEARIAAALAADAGTSGFDAIDCRAALCRLSGHYDDVAAYNRAVDVLFVAPAGAIEHGGIVAEPRTLADGSLEVTVYMARAGRPELLRRPR